MHNKILTCDIHVACKFLASYMYIRITYVHTHICRTFFFPWHFPDFLDLWRLTWKKYTCKIYVKIYKYIFVAKSCICRIYILFPWGRPDLAYIYRCCGIFSIYVTRYEKRDLWPKSKNLHGDERLKKSKPAPNALEDCFSIIHILQKNVDKKFLISPHERPVQKLIESRIVRKSIFWIEGPFSRIASHM